MTVFICLDGGAAVSLSIDSGYTSAHISATTNTTFLRAGCTITVTLNNGAI
jgi:hypothetical protein